jgi:hypothetical protein
MKGGIVEYISPWSGSYYLGIVIDSMSGFHVRKSWSGNRKFVEQDMIRIYWLNEPSDKPPTAREQIAKMKNPDYEQLRFNFIENSNSIIDEWTRLTEEYEWYFPDHFFYLESEECDD